LASGCRVDSGVQRAGGKSLDDGVAGKAMLVVAGRIVLSPSGASHYMGERLGAKLEIDHVPPGETLQIGWRWRTPESSENYRFLVPGRPSARRPWRRRWRSTPRSGACCRPPPSGRPV